MADGDLLLGARRARAHKTAAAVRLESSEVWKAQLAGTSQAAIEWPRPARTRRSMMSRNWSPAGARVRELVAAADSPLFAASRSHANAPGASEAPGCPLGCPPRSATAGLGSERAGEGNRTPFLSWGLGFRSIPSPGPAAGETDRARLASLQKPCQAGCPDDSGRRVMFEGVEGGGDSGRWRARCSLLQIAGVDVVAASIR